MYKKLVCLVLAVILALAGLLPQPVLAKEEKVKIDLSGNADLKNGCLLWESGEGKTQDLKIKITGLKKGDEPKVISRNEDLISAKLTDPKHIRLKKKGKGPGTCKIVVKYKGVSASLTVIVPPSDVKIVSVRQVSNESIFLKWKKFGKADGYRIFFCRKGQAWKQLKLIKGGDTTSCQIAFRKKPAVYRFAVIPCFKTKEKVWTPGKDSEIGSNVRSATLKFKQLQPKISSLKASGSQITISWKRDKKAALYQLYRSESENGEYKKIFSSETETSYTDQGKPGHTYAYRLRVTYKDRTKAMGSSRSIYLQKTASPRSKTLPRKESFFTPRQYGWDNVIRPTITFDKKRGRMYIVRQNDMEYTVYRVYSTLNIKKVNSFTIDSYYAGPAYAGHDGNFYVVAGNDNYGESDDQTVFEVIQFDENWNRVKTASIPSEGRVCIPFFDGNVSMTMRGKDLYVFTSAGGYADAVGDNPRASIGFLIDTETMTGTYFDPAHTAGAINQKAVFKDDSLYLAEHSVSRPRAVKVTIVDDFDGKRSTESLRVFDIVGKKKEYTGLTLGDMAVGKSKIVAAGTSKPQDYEIQGVTGNDPELKNNVYLVTVDRKTHEVKRKWLTNKDPLNSDTEIGECRLVKIDDGHFAVIYGQIQNGRESTVVKIVNEAGKVLSTHKYKGYIFPGGQQPVLWDGCLFWLASDWSNDQGIVTYAYAVPIEY